VKPLSTPAGSISGTALLVGGVVDVLDEDDEFQCMDARVLPKSLWTMLALAAVAAAKDTAIITTNLPTALSLPREVKGTDRLCTVPIPATHAPCRQVATPEQWRSP